MSPTIPRTRLRTGLNPYGLTYHLGLQARGTPRANPRGTGLAGFLALAEEIGARTLEVWDGWLRELSPADLAALRRRLADKGMEPIVSSGLHHGDVDTCLALAEALGAGLIRLALTPILCGDRAAAGPLWSELVAGVGEKLARYAPLAAERGLTLVIENHQDFTSAELVGFCERFGPSVRIVFDTGNAFPVAESPLDFAQTIAPHVAHIHLKDYRVQFTDDGFRLVRCAIGDGAVPFVGILEIFARHHASLPAVLEPGALDMRHVRLLTPDWWRGYPPRSAEALARCLAAAQVNRLPEDADCRTPWEAGADDRLDAYELAMIRRSAANMRALGILD